ncbi:MAG: hypothetical protein IJ643_07925 [Eubacterium sp.]|nr:hypothetical protein [Eubacterium sp.]
MKKHIKEFDVDIEVFVNSENKIEFVLQSEKSLNLVIHNIFFFDKNGRNIYHQYSFNYPVSIDNNQNGSVIDAPNTDIISKVSLSIKNKDNNEDVTYGFNIK